MVASTARKQRFRMKYVDFEDLARDGAYFIIDTENPSPIGPAIKAKFSEKQYGGADMARKAALVEKKRLNALDEVGLIDEWGNELPPVGFRDPKRMVPGRSVRVGSYRRQR